MSGYIGNIPVPQATQSREVFTATSGQTTFATVGYPVGFVDVWLNGVKLVAGTDFTATNGSDVVLTVGAATGDTVEVISNSTFEVNSQTFTGTTTLTGDLQATTATFSGAVTGTNLTLSGGVYLGGTGAANLLDDYEEGTFTPTLGGNYTGTYADQYGHYTKIGNVVTFRVFLGIGTTGGSGYVYVAGLPFASSSVARYTAYQGWTNSWASNAHPQFILTTSTTIYVYTLPSSGSTTQSTIANMGSSGNIIITGHYYTDA